MSRWLQTAGGRAQNIPAIESEVYAGPLMRYGNNRGVMDRPYHVGFMAGALAGLALGVPAGHVLLRERAESPVAVSVRTEQFLPSEPPQTRVAALVDEGRRALRSGQAEKALAAALEAERLEPDNANIKNNLCAYLGELRRYDDAISACQASLALQPNFQLARNNLAWVQTERAEARASASSGRLLTVRRGAAQR